MLEVDDIHTYYGSSYIVQGVSLTVPDHAAVALLGRNGMGKTTTIRSVMGLTPPRAGRVLYGGRRISGLPSHVVARAGLALVPQGRRIFPSLTVRENLLVPTRRASSSSNAWSLDRVYALFPILYERRNQLGGLLSGGQQQMLAISRALMTNPTLLLMDEPSEGLSPAILHQLIDVIKQLKADGLSILLVEQNVRMALDLSEYVYILSKGRLVYGSTAEALRNQEGVMAAHLGVS
jgi:branched-chain amino acid transport system ATP-binding protein